MEGFENARDDAINDLNYYRSYENELIHRYGVKWKKEISIEEETELESRKNRVDWKLLGIEKRA